MKAQMLFAGAAAASCVVMFADKFYDWEVALFASGQI